MDKKKVIELIEQISNAINLHLIAATEIAYDTKCKVLEKLEEVKSELSKPDWISVEDELPPIGDVVRVRSKQNPNDLMLACRIDENTMKVVYPLNKFYSQDITHWRKIDKLEV